MTHQPTLDQYNSSKGLHILLQAADDASGGFFINGMLTALFLIVMMGTYFAQKRLTNKGDFPASFAVAGIFTAIVAVVMTLIPDMISTWTVVATIVIAVIGFIFVSITREN